MTDQTENQPDPTHPEKKSNPADKDETRPTRRITHPDRTRLSRPQVTPPQTLGDKKPAPPAQQPGLPETEPDLKAVPPKQPSIRSGEPAVQSDQRPAAPANPNLTRPTRPVARQPRPAFTQQPPARPSHRSQPQPPARPPASYLPPTQEVQTRPPSQDLQPTVAAQAVQAKPKRRLWRSITTLFWIGLILGILVLGIGIAGYVWIALQLPPAEELRARSFRFATTQILDREGNLLWEIIDPTGGRRTRVPLDQISPDLINATVATEDRFFYANVGVDPVAVVRAVYYNVSEGEIVSGGSTITQQLARNVLLSPEERTEQSLSRKIREAVLAVEINRQYSKEQILDVYLNQIYYGNLAYGIEAASQTYFGKRASDLNLAEASMLAGLPQAPSIHDPYLNPEGAKARQADVLRLMVEAGYITAAEATEAGNTPLDFREVNFALEAPHFVSFVRQELERNFPADYIYQAGLRVKTTLDPRLQAIAEEEVRSQVDALAGRNVSNGALVSIDVATGQVLAMVGSKDFENEAIDGQVNMATSPRQPGSSIKPLTYLATFETLNWTPSTLIMDTPVEYPDGAGGVYRPLNYDEKFHGPVSLRRALANSYNIPPVKALALLGVDKLQQMAARLGITTLSEGDFGLALTLGGGEVPLVELTGAYQAMANQGVRLGPTAILEITDNFGRVVGPIPTNPQQVLREEHAYLISHILSDNEARTPAFGPNSVLNLSRPAAAKTGTTTDFRDSWIMGYTPDIVTGVWVGNADNTPMSGIGGSNGAGPIWQRFMERAHEGLPIRDFTRPATIISLEVCADSGTIPSPACPERRTEIFFKDQPPLGPEHDIHQLIEIDRNTGLRANEFCRANVEERYFRVYPPDGVEWAISQGFEQPPTDFCPSANILAEITNPLDGSTARGTISLEGVAAAENFSHYQVEMGSGTNPDSFINVAGPINQMVNRGVLGVFDTTLVENGAYTLRLLVFDRSSGLGEARVRLLVDNVPTPAPTVTPTPTLTPTATATITPTVTATLEPTATTTLAPTNTPPPTTTPVLSATATKMPANTPTKVPAATNTPAVQPSPTQGPANTPTLPIELPTATVTPTPAGEAGISTATPSP